MTNANGVHALERVTRYQQALAGDYLEWSLAQVGAVLAAKNPPEFLSRQLRLGTKLSEQLRDRWSEFLSPGGKALPIAVVPDLLPRVDAPPALEAAAPITDAPAVIPAPIAETPVPAPLMAPLELIPSTAPVSGVRKRAPAHVPQAPLGASDRSHQGRNLPPGRASSAQTKTFGKRKPS